MTFDEQARELHARHHGKLATALKIPLDTKADLSLAYTPGVGLISSDIAVDVSLAKKYTNIGNTVAIITDGSAVLGLGNIGPAAAMPVMEGKAALFKRFADIDAVPLCLATQDTDQIIETVAALAPSFAGINLEDIAAPRCFEIEAKLRARLSVPVFHDDQHGTATVVLAGLINALKLRELTFADARVVINGAGAAGIAIAELLWDAGMHQMIVLDSKGALSMSRTDLTPEKKLIAEKTHATGGTLADALVGAHVFIGVSVANALTKDMVRSMNERPIIFAMANPVPEIHPDDAHDAGVYIMATGRSDFPNQINNALAFPGLFRGALDTGTREITHAHLIKAAHAIASLVADPTPTTIIPDIFDTRLVSTVALVFA